MQGRKPDHQPAEPDPGHAGGGIEMSLALEGRGAGQIVPPFLSVAALSARALSVGKAIVSPQVVALAGALLAWEGTVRFFELPLWYLPAPSHVAVTMVRNLHLILPNAGVTAIETLLGLVIGIAIGMALALGMGASRWLAQALSPLAVVSQAIPFMALAPLMMIWFGFGITSKVAMAAITIFFSVTAAFYEGLRRADENLIDLAKLYGASPWQILFNIRVPAALPHLCAGLKLAAAYAPLGAIAGEWVGSDGGLGIMMTYHNARMQTDMVFAAMVVLIVFCLSTWLLMSLLTRHLLRNFPDTLNQPRS
jgi:putative hydroxymethylpyrimidine transport system permease protein